MNDLVEVFRKRHILKRLKSGPTIGSLKGKNKEGIVFTENCHVRYRKEKFVPSPREWNVHFLKVSS